MIEHILDLSGTIEAQILSMMHQTPLKKWRCSVCGKGSMYKTDISRHVESVHITDHPGYECSFCGAICKSKNSLRQHMNTRHRE